MTEPDLSQITFGRAAPGIAVSDIDAAITFYTDVLGMRVTFTNGSPVGFAVLRRNDAEVHLTLAAGHRGSVSNAAHLMVSDATALYEQLRDRGVRIVKGLRDADHGLRGFVFADPDGNRIDVGQPLGDR